MAYFDFLTFQGWNLIKPLEHFGGDHRIGPPKKYCTGYGYGSKKVPKGNTTFITFSMVFVSSIFGGPKILSHFELTYLLKTYTLMTFPWDGKCVVFFWGGPWLCMLQNHCQGGNHEVWIWKQELVDQDGIDAGHLQRGITDEKAWESLA